MLQTITTTDAPTAIGPYAQAVRVGEWLYCSGQIAIDPATGALQAEADVGAQTTLVLRNLSAVLHAASGSLHSVVKTTVFLRDLNEFSAMNTAYAAAFGDHRPARACVEVARLPRDVRVEIDAVAWLGAVSHL
ncbi:MAG: RidA family protein [Deltaproteobacteria bacterium]|nr:RidA family protein [Deltaproteobacteria bacterium]